MSKNEIKSIVRSINRVGDRVFLNPAPTIEYEDLIKASLGPNTYRGFHKIDKEGPGAKDVFEGFFLEHRYEITERINGINSAQELDLFENEICDDLRENLRVNIRNDQLNSYNKLRKPIDIVIEHLVSTGNEFGPARENLVQYLYLPLDSQMFRSNLIFSEFSLQQLGLRRTFTFKDVQTECEYKQIQCFISGKAEGLGVLHRIYLDLVWNDRFRSNGGNILETNP